MRAQKKACWNLGTFVENNNYTFYADYSKTFFVHLILGIEL
jgi:hypothetical protein